MRLVAIVELFVLSGIIGLAVYCVSCALHVWHARSARSSVTTARRGLPRSLRRGALVLAVLGLGGMALSAAWNAIVSREGLLVGEGLFTVQRPEGLDVGQLASADDNAKGTLLVQYRCPKREAEISVLRLRQQSLEIQEQILTSEPLAADSQITAQISELSLQQQSLRRDLNDLTMEKDRVGRDYLREQVTKQDEIAKLQRAFDRLKSELQQTINQSRLHQSELNRYSALRKGNAITVEQYVDKDNQVRHDFLQAQKLQEELNNVQRDRNELQRGLEQLKAVSQEQSAMLEKNIASLRPQLQDAESRLQEFQRRRAEDLTRAAQHRRETHKRLGVDRQQVEQQLSGLNGAMQVSAPFAGRVVYRAPSPNSVRTGEPLIVLAASNAFRFHIQLPSWARKPLETAGAVPMEFLESPDKEQERRFVRSHFLGALTDWKDLPDYAGYGVAELCCEPPQESIRWLARGEELPARLVWQPPLYRIPAFLISALATVSGLGAWGLLKRMAPKVLDKAVAVRELPAPPQLALGEATVEYGAEGTMLRMLGVQLRQCIARGQPDPNIIAAAEWALDRHRARAVRLLAFGLSPDAELRADVDNLLKVRSTDGEPSSGELEIDDGSLGRLVNLLRVLSPESVPPAPGWLSWQRTPSEPGQPCRPNEP